MELLKDTIVLNFFSAKQDLAGIWSQVLVVESHFGW